MLCRLTFTVSDDQNLLCSLTRQHPGTRVVIRPLMSEPGKPASDAIYTIIGNDGLLDRFIKNHLEPKYGTVEEVARYPGAVSLRIGLQLPVVARGEDPLVMALRFLGPDTVVLPLMVEDGRIRCTLLTANVEGQQKLTALVDTVTSVLKPGAFVIEHLGPVDLPGKTPVTDAQLEVTEAALALGYYETPRRCTLEDIAKALGLSKAAVHKRLQRAEASLIRSAVSRISRNVQAPIP